MPVKYRLDVLNGPRSSEKIPLKVGKPLLIGRTKTGIDLLDPRVSTRHAELSWAQDRVWIRDLESATGTLVDGVTIFTEAVPLGHGSRLVIGDTTLVLTLERTLLPRWAYWIILAALALLVIYVANRIVDMTLAFGDARPKIEAPNPVSGHDGAPVDPGGDYRKVPLDRCFMREVMPLDEGFHIRRVTDWDGDQVSELWIEGATWERVYTFAPDGTWELLGELPKGCQNTEGAQFRPLTCGFQRYNFREGVPLVPDGDRCAQGSNKGHYELDDMDGAIVWMPNRETDGPEGAPRPYQMTIRGKENMSSWLGERGVEEAVHFIVCEEMFIGMGAQALTKSGRIEQLQPGCASSLDIGGTMRTLRYKREMPVAVAFTETGRRLLTEQVSVFLGGSERHHFQSGPQRAWARQIGATPAYDTASYLIVNPGPTAAPRFFKWLPREDESLRLDPLERLRGLPVPGKLRADTWLWTAEHKGGVLRTPCNNIVRVEPKGWRCGPPCFSGSTEFLEINEVNGVKISVPYQTTIGKVYRGNNVEISVDVHSPSGQVPQATASTIAVRDLEVCVGSGERSMIPVRP